MDLFGAIVLTIIIFIWDYNRRQRIKKRMQKEGLLRETIVYKVPFPNPKTVSKDKIQEFLDEEYRIIVLRKYIDLCKEMKADDEIIKMAHDRMMEVFHSYD